jgi:hypothetical protein
MRPLRIDPGLLQFCTSRQREVLSAAIQHGSLRAASRALGINQSAITRSLQSVEAKAAAHGYAPQHDMTRVVPAPFVVRGTSTLYDGDGKLRAQWVKTRLDDEAWAEAVQEAIEAFVAASPALPVAPVPLDMQRDVVPWIQIGDAHIGMLAHAAETGEQFDLETAERDLCAGIAQLIDEMPPCERIVINDLGDATHYDNIAATTAASGHPLDVDGRLPSLLRVYSRTMRFIVDRALTRARNVDVIVNQGNHSRVNDFWMVELLRVAYREHAHRVHVLNNDSAFVGYRMGQTFVMVHHSDKCRPERLVGVLTHDFREDFGATRYHYIDVGHVHHKFVSREHPSVVIEAWNTLAGRDRWAHESGYRSRQSITVVLRSRRYGEVGRRVLPIEEIRDRLNRPARKVGVHTV